MTDDQVKALLIVAALLSGASGSAGFVGGRMSVSAPPAEVRFVQVPVPAMPAVPAEPIPVEPPPAAALPVVPIEPPAVSVAPVEVKPLPPKVDVKPKATIKPQAKPEAKSRPAAPKKSLPSCAVVQRENARMTWSEKMAAYHSATPEQVAHGKRCLGM